MSLQLYPSSILSFKPPDALHCSTYFPSPCFLFGPKTTLFFISCSHREVSLCTTTNETVSKTAIQRISEKLRSLGYVDEINKEKPELGPGSAGEIFIPSSHELPKNRVGHTIDRSWSSPENPIPEPGSGFAITRFHEIKREVEKQKGLESSTKKREAVPTAAELTIAESEMKRLRSIGMGLEKKIIVGKAGITEGIVNGIHERWRRSELVKIKCEDLCRLNMKWTHEILERKTGGLVVWRAGSVIILYRGANYEYPYFLSGHGQIDGILEDETSPKSDLDYENAEGEADSLHADGGNIEASKPIQPGRLARSSLILGVSSPQKVRFQLPGEVQLEEEADRLLDGLGPRFTDWWGNDPLPVDADLLPPIVTGYRKPFRILPYGVKPKLTDSEMTVLKRLGRPLPCHFALGRNRNLQGLAVAMIKLWGKCEIAKIAVKRGVQNTNSEIMSEELKRLTGGILLSRDREFIVFYRGKDFLHPAVSTAIEERRKYEMYKNTKMPDLSSSHDTKSEHEAELAPLAKLVEGASDLGEHLNAEQRRLHSENLANKKMEIKLSLALLKKEKAEKLLEELGKAEEMAKPEVDREGISEEERYMLRKVGLRMKAFLLLGRRGVFDGTVENMHLHWKYRQLVKIICKDRSISEVHKAAHILESESGGILVAVERVNKGHAIIVYRGKNYERPAHLRPKTLLNKREAMRRSLERQRYESLKLHVLKLNKNIEQLKLQVIKDDSKGNCGQSTELMSSTFDFQEGDECEVDASSSHPIEFMDSLRDGEEIANSAKESAFYADDKKVDFISDGADEFPGIRSDSSPEPALTKTSSALFVDKMADKYDHRELTSHPQYMMSQLGSSSADSLTDDEDDGDDDVARFSDVKLGESSVESSLISSRSSLLENEIPFRAEPLSNRDRLVLRKQALKMKKRAIFAIGRSNAITGLAKAIITHFRKYPLAIVNVKGRAKGTSVQEVVFELEQATGGVLVSREPNKVILYRGWGAGEMQPGKMGKEDVRGTAESGDEEVSPQLMDAIRLECGLQPAHNQV